MSNEFEKFRGLKVLNFFLGHPSLEINIRGLAKKLRISTMSAKTYCDLLENNGFLKSQKKGLAKFFWLDNKSPVVKARKCAYMLERLVQNRIEEAFANNPFYIYGSVARGEYDGDSDVDIFVIKIHETDEKKLEKFKKNLGWEVSVVEVPFYELKKYVEEHPELIEQIKKNGKYFGDEQYGL